MKKIVLMLLSLTMVACSGAAKKEKKEMSLEEIVNSDHRSEKNRSRNQHRHPVETLKFFEVEPNMTVVELSPGGGWYTEILGPYLRDEGVLYLAIFDENSDRSYAARLNKIIKELVEDKQLYGKVNFTTIDSPKVLGPVAPEGTADRVLTFRNVHSWMSDGKLKDAFESAFKALKPGGILGVVAHRSKLKGKTDPKAKKGYANQDDVKKVAESAGFEFVASSEINANPKDTTDYPDGVWTLPPSLKLKEKDKAKYEAIGESDRMTLKFKKPNK